MMMQNVKNTIISSLADAFAPYYCNACGEIGSVLCDRCVYDIVSESYSQCLICQSPTLTDNVKCSQCSAAYSRAWCVGERSAVLQRMIGNFKFTRQQSTYAVLAKLLDATLPHLPADCVVCYVPSIRAHMRQRGYDHAALIAHEFSRLRNLNCKPVLRRIDNEQQRGASKARRIAQAKRSFTVASIIDPAVPYLIIDDVFTTGSTLEWAARRIREAGAKEVWIAVIARQPLDK